MIRLGTLLFTLFFLLMLSCIGTRKNNVQEDYTVAFYNLENLFDTIDDPLIKDEDFLPSGDKKWDTKKYNKKLENLASVIAWLGDENGPEVIGFCELENKQVVEDLVAHEKLKDRKYQIIHSESQDKRGIDVAFGYKESFMTHLSHRIIPVIDTIDSNFKTRDILLINGKVGSDTVHFLVNHWPSKLGKEEEGARKRNLAAIALRNAVDSLVKRDQLARIIIMGDFNDEPDNISIVDVLQAKPLVNPAFKDQLINLMYDLKIQGKGSYVYKDNINMLDQFIVSLPLYQGQTRHLRFIPGSASVFSPDWLKEPEGKFKGSPMRTFGGRTYLGGYSDHFPIYMKLTNK